MNQIYEIVKTCTENDGKTVDQRMMKLMEEIGELTTAAKVKKDAREIQLEAVDCLNCVFSIMVHFGETQKDFFNLWESSVVRHYNTAKQVSPSRVSMNDVVISAGWLAEAVLSVEKVKSNIYKNKDIKDVLHLGRRMANYLIYVYFRAMKNPPYMFKQDVMEKCRKWADKSGISL